MRRIVLLGLGILLLCGPSLASTATSVSYYLVADGSGGVAADPNAPTTSSPGYAETDPRSMSFERSGPALPFHNEIPLPAGTVLHAGDTFLLHLASRVALVDGTFTTLVVLDRLRDGSTFDGPVGSASFVSRQAAGGSDAGPAWTDLRVPVRADTTFGAHDTLLLRVFVLVDPTVTPPLPSTQALSRAVVDAVEPRLPARLLDPGTCDPAPAPFALACRAEIGDLNDDAYAATRDTVRQMPDQGPRALDGTVATFDSFPVATFRLGTQTQPTRLEVPIG